MAVSRCLVGASTAATVGASRAATTTAVARIATTTAVARIATATIYDNNGEAAHTTIITMMSSLLSELEVRQYLVRAVTEPHRVNVAWW